MCTSVLRIYWWHAVPLTPPSWLHSKTCRNWRQSMSHWKFHIIRHEERKFNVIPSLCFLMLSACLSALISCLQLYLFHLPSGVIPLAVSNRHLPFLWSGSCTQIATPTTRVCTVSLWPWTRPIEFSSARSPGRSTIYGSDIDIMMGNLSAQHTATTPSRHRGERGEQHLQSVRHWHAPCPYFHNPQLGFSGPV